MRAIRRAGSVASSLRRISASNDVALCSRASACHVARMSTGADSDAGIKSHPSGLTLWGDGKGLGLGLPASRPAYYKESPPSEFVKRYWYLLKSMGVFSRRANTGVASEAIFRSVEEQGTQEGWWAALGLTHNWITEHALISLHVWLFHNRFKVDYNVAGDFNGRRMQEQLFERFWEDTTYRIRNAGIAEISVNKQLENVQKITFDDMFSYDAALKVDDDDNMELAAAVWKGVFREDENANTEAVLMLADYVRREVTNLMLQPQEDVYRGWITWGPIVGETDAARMERQRRMLQGEWREALHPDGRLYFYHTSTHETRWDPPSEGLYNRRRFALARYIETNPAVAARLGGGAASAASLPAAAGESAAATTATTAASGT